MLTLVDVADDDIAAALRGAANLNCLVIECAALRLDNATDLHLRVSPYPMLRQFEPFDC